MLDPAFEEAVRARIRASLFASWMGLDLTTLDDGTSELRLRVEPHHLNPGGIVHGGVIAGLLDAAIGLALRTRLGADRTHVTVNLSINYVRPCAGGTLIARGRAVHSGDRVGFGEAELLDRDLRLLARATAAFLVVPAAAPWGPLLAPP